MNIDAHLKEQIFRETLDNKVLVLNATVLKRFKLKIAGEYTLDFYIDKVAFQLKKFSPEGEKPYGLLVRKSGNSDNFAKIDAVDFSQPTLTINRRKLALSEFVPQRAPRVKSTTPKKPKVVKKAVVETTPEPVVEESPLVDSTIDTSSSNLDSSSPNDGVSDTFHSQAAHIQEGSQATSSPQPEEPSYKEVEVTSSTVAETIHSHKHTSSTEPTQTLKDLREARGPATDLSDVSQELKDLYQETTSHYKQKPHIIDAKEALYKAISHTPDKDVPGDSANLAEIPQIASEPFTNEKLEESKKHLQSIKSMIDSYSFNTDTFLTFEAEVDLEKIFSLNKNYNFWFSFDESLISVDTFWHHLKSFYKTTPKTIEYKLKNIYINEVLPVSSSLSRSSAESIPGFLTRLQAKVADLNAKNEILEKQIAAFQAEIVSDETTPEDSPEYLKALGQQVELAKALNLAKLNLENFKTKLQEIISNESSVEAKFYVHAYGRDCLISKYDELVAHKLLSFNQQIQQILSCHEELERVLIEKIQKLHKARKAHAKLHVLEQEELVSSHIAQHQKSKELVAAEQRKKILSEVGDLHESSAIIQEKINAEYRKVTYFLDNLKTIEDIDGYEEKLKALKQEKDALKLKKDSFSKYLHRLKLKLHTAEEGSCNFITSLCKTINSFQQEVLDAYKEHKALVGASTEKLWNDWHSNGVKLINHIFEKKKQIIGHFADVVLLQVKNIYKNQLDLYQSAKQRQADWEKVLAEIHGEFLALGFVLDEPQSVSVDYSLIEDIEAKNLKLSPDTRKLLFYQPEFKIKTAPEYLYGLEPRNIDDDQFIIIDQVWKTLSPEQQEELEQKVKAENETVAALNQLQKIKVIQEDMAASLEAQRAKYRKTNILDTFPKIANKEELDAETALFEKYLLHSWKEQNFTKSNMLGQIKESLYNISKNILSLKSVFVVNSRLEISDTGNIPGNAKTEIFTENDYFMKPDKISNFSDADTDPDMSISDSELYDIDDGEYLEIVDSLDTLQEERAALESGIRPPKPPTLEEWAQISIKKFRDKQKMLDVESIQNKLLLLEDEIAKITKIQSQHVEAFEIDLAKRDLIADDIKLELLKIQQFLINQENELNSIIADTQQQIDQSIDKTTENI